MPEHQMHQALESVGGIATIQAASVDALLKVNHWLRFLLESYPNGYVDPHDPERIEISASQLYLTYCHWMKQEGHQPTTNTTFGESIKRLVRVKSCDLDPALPIYKRRTKFGWVYTIRSMKDLNLVDFFGVDTGSAEPDYAPVHSQEPGIAPQEPFSGSIFRQSVYTVNCSPRSLPSASGGGSHVPMHKGIGPNYAQHASKSLDRLMTNEECVLKALQSGCSEVAEVVEWILRNLHKKVSRSNAEMWMRRHCSGR